MTCLALCLLLVVTGCATQGSRFMRYETAAGDAPVWPLPPEVARYRYVGQLTGEENFALVGSANAGRRALAWLVGLAAGKRTPVVLQRPQGGVTDTAGRVYVTDVSRGAVYVFDEVAGRLKVWEMAGPDQRFQTPLGIAVVEDRRVLVADGDLAKVIVLDAQGRPVDSFGEGVLQRPVGLAYDPTTSRVFVADRQAHDVKVFDVQGRLLEIWGRLGVGAGEFNAPTYLTFAYDRLYVTDTFNSRIQIFDTAGRFLYSVGRRGLYLGDLPRPKGVAVDRDRNLYVVESYYDHLLVFNEQGEFLLPIGGTGNGIGEFYLPAGVWTDHRNWVYVADAFNGRVVVFEYLGET